MYRKPRPRVSKAELWNLTLQSNYGVLLRHCTSCLILCTNAASAHKSQAKDLKKQKCCAYLKWVSLQDTLMHAVVCTSMHSPYVRLEGWTWSIGLMWSRVTKSDPLKPRQLPQVHRRYSRHWCGFPSMCLFNSWWLDRSFNETVSSCFQIQRFRIKRFKRLFKRPQRFSCILCYVINQQLRLAQKGQTLQDAHARLLLAYTKLALHEFGKHARNGQFAALEPAGKLS